jgi:hypothetical protein
MALRYAARPVAPTGDFTAQEELRVRSALRFLHSRCGNWGTLAHALRVSENTVGAVAAGRKAVSAALVVRIAKFAAVGVDDVLCGRFPAAGTCPHCGQSIPEQPAPTDGSAS